MTKNRKRVGLNAQQIRVLGSVRNLPDAMVALMARQATKILQLKPCPQNEVNVDPYLFLPEDVVKAGFSTHTISRFTEFLLGIARKPGEHEDSYHDRKELFDHSYAPLVRDSSGKVHTRWRSINFPSHSPLPHRLISERLLLFMALGITVVKGNKVPEKKRLREVLEEISGIKPAKACPISPDDEVRYWKTVTSEVTQVDLFTEKTAEAPEAAPVEPANTPVGALVHTDSPTDSAKVPFAEGMNPDLTGIGSSLRSLANQIDTLALDLLSEETIEARVAERVAERMKDLAGREEDLQERLREADKREEFLSQKESALKALLTSWESGNTTHG
jgi:hypothetical protein